MLWGSEIIQRGENVLASQKQNYLVWAGKPVSLTSQNISGALSLVNMIFKYKRDRRIARINLVESLTDKTLGKNYWVVRKRSIICRDIKKSSRQLPDFNQLSWAICSQAQKRAFADSGTIYSQKTRKHTTTICGRSLLYFSSRINRMVFARSCISNGLGMKALMPLCFTFSLSTASA